MKRSCTGMKYFTVILLALVLTMVLWGCRRTEETPPMTVSFHGESMATDVTALDLSGHPLEGLDQLVLLRDLRLLDLRGTGMTVKQYQILKGLNPDCRILWDPVFQGTAYPETTRHLQVETLTEEDVADLAYFPNLQRVDAAACRDYEALLLLLQTYPDLSVSYVVQAGGKILQPLATKAELVSATPEELDYTLRLLPKLESVLLKGDLPEVAYLLKLREQYPELEIRWQVEIHGRVFDGDAVEIDLCGIPMEDVRQVEEKSQYFSQLEKVLMWDCGISNEEMEALNQRNDQVLFVWMVDLGEMVRVRTDIDNFICHNYNHFLTEEECYNFRYCTEIVALDLGHRDIFHCDFIAYMHKLKYLILADTYVSDLTPLTGLENLVFLEIFLLDIDSYEPLLTLTGLEDLNIGFTRGDIEIIKQMTWLKKLWWTGDILTWEEQAALRAALPNTQTCFELGYSSTGGGWRKNPNYYAMRELLGMPDES